MFDFNLINEYGLMVLGTPLTSEQMAALTGLYDRAGDYSDINSLVDTYMTSRAASLSDGENSLVQEIARAGFGLTLDDTSAAGIVEFFNVNGYDTWAERLAFCSALGGDLGQTLQNRAFAAEAFRNVLDAPSELTAFASANGQAVVSVWLSQVTSEASTLATALANIESTISAMSSPANGNTGAHAGDAVIDLGDYGNLIFPVQLAGRWYYYWDRSGDGTSDYGLANVEDDAFNHDELDVIFTEDVNGHQNTGSNTDNTFRYATINGVRLALPSLGDGQSNISSIYYLADHGDYTDMADIWGSFNSGNGTIGAPSGWRRYDYWTASPASSGHVAINFYNGSVYQVPSNLEDIFSLSVAVQVF